MTRCAPLEPAQLPQWSAGACAVVNELYTRGPVTLDGWQWRFEYRTRLAPNCRVRIQLSGPMCERSVRLHLHTGESDYPWWDYDEQTRVLAWCAGHDKLLAFLDVLLDGEPIVQAVDTLDGVPSAAVDAGQVEAGFSVRDEHDALRWHGTVALGPNSLAEAPSAAAGNDTWERLPARLPIELARVHTSLDEVGRIEVGSVVRLNGSPTDSGSALTLYAGDVRLQVRIGNRQLRVESVS